ncbi:MAG: hypothetical protein ACRCZ0_05990 [Cetobacterium sp.]
MDEQKRARIALLLLEVMSEYREEEDYVEAKIEVAELAIRMLATNISYEELVGVINKFVGRKIVGGNL